MTTHHMCVDIRGALMRLANSRGRRSDFTHDDGRPMTRDEAIDGLMDELAKGRRVLPMGTCEGFDYQTGCPGHEGPRA